MANNKVTTALLAATAVTGSGVSIVTGLPSTDVLTRPRSLAHFEPPARTQRQALYAGCLRLGALGTRVPAECSSRPSPSVGTSASFPPSARNPGAEPGRALDRTAAAGRDVFESADEGRLPLFASFINLEKFSGQRLKKAVSKTHTRKKPI